ncbi:hypothetical protein B0H11DRAFT_1923221 [Mycena galericulata]|nr:hypothetical protein B0H11DRAFT_1923221 [Mycena galericulata]
MNPSKMEQSRTDDKESLEVAIQCIGEAFGVDPSDEQQTREKVGANAATASASASTSSQPKAISPEDKARAEKFKQSGNTLMSSKQYDQAIESYTQAIALDPANAIYYSNRAAAYSSKGDHLSAVGDAEQAIAIDPKVRESIPPTWVRFCRFLITLVSLLSSHAQYSLTDFRAAADAFERGLKLDPTNVGLKSGLENSTARIVPDEEDVPPPLIPDDGSAPSSARGAGGAPAGLGGLGGMADILAGLGGGGAGGGGGMPDLASMMNNPQMMAMAQQMMANGGLANLMGNPAVANMMNRVQSGDLPSMEDIMSDPSLRNLYATQSLSGGRH